MRNQKGLTIVELLAGMVIVGIFSIIIWRVLFQTLDTNSYVITEQTLQQEANIILSSLQYSHTKYEIDKITLDPDSTKLSIIYRPNNNITVPKQSFSKPGITYQLYSAQPSTNSASEVNQLLPNTKNNNRIDFPIHLKLSAKDSKGRTISYILSTTLSKLTSK